MSGDRAAYDWETGPAEQAFAVTRRHVRDGASGRMPIGPWVCGPDATPTAGALGLLVDSVLSLWAFAAQERGMVSTEIAFDVLGALPAPGSVAHAVTDRLDLGPDSGFVTGSVLDDHGHTVLACRQRVRLIPAGSPAAGGTTPAPVPSLPAAPSLAALLGLQEGPAHLVHPAAPHLCNAMGNLHGGVILAAAEAAAHHTVDRDGGPVLPTASVHVTYLRAVPGGAEVELRTSVQHRGRSLAVVDVVAHAQGRACALVRVVLQAT